MIRTRLVKCGLFELVQLRWPKGHRIPHHSHTGTCIMSVKSGTLLEETPKHQKVLGDGSFSVSYRNDSHSVTAIESSVSYHIYFNKSI